MFLKVIQLCVVLVMKGGQVEMSPPRCDSSVNTDTKEGVIGESAMFQWLGVIKVNLKAGSSHKVALTGIILIKEGYAIANADDVARIPKRIFQEQSIAMFIPQDNVPWFCRLKDYLTHPEYQQGTIISIALVELDAGDKTMHPMRPICWPSYAFQNTDKLYVAGYTDDNNNNNVLEKFILKLRRVDKVACKDYYEKAKLSESKVSPKHYQCAFTLHSSHNCIWDNGMALISNVSGYWTLIGLGLLGPGCAAPGRFIDLMPYYQWIDSATNPQKVANLADYRRTAFNEGFKPQQKPEEDIDEVEEIPTHDLLRSTNNTSERVSGKHKFAHYYPFDVEADSRNFWDIKRINQSVIYVQRITKNRQTGNCSLRTNRLIYKDYFRIIATRTGTARYQLSMYDLRYLNYTCVKLQVHTKYPEYARLWYAYEIDQLEGLGHPDNPDEIIRVYPIIKLHPTTTGKPGTWRNHPGLKMKNVVEDSAEKYDVYNVNIYFRIIFRGYGWFKVKVFGPHRGITTSTEKVTTQSTTTKKTPSTTNPYYQTNDPNIKKSLRNQDTIRDDELSKEESINTESIYESTTISSNFWGMHIDDDNHDNRTFWNSWTRLKDKLNKNRLSNVNKILRHLKNISHFSTSQPTQNKYLFFKEESNHQIKIYDTTKSDTVTKTSVTEQVNDYLNEYEDNAANKTLFNNFNLQEHLNDKKYFDEAEYLRYKNLINNINKFVGNKNQDNEYLGIQLESVENQRNNKLSVKNSINDYLLYKRINDAANKERIFNLSRQEKEDNSLGDSQHVIYQNILDNDRVHEQENEYLETQLETLSTLSSEDKLHSAYLTQRTHNNSQENQNQLVDEQEYQLGKELNSLNVDPISEITLNLNSLLKTSKDSYENYYSNKIIPDNVKVYLGTKMEYTPNENIYAFNDVPAVVEEVKRNLSCELRIASFEFILLIVRLNCLLVMFY